SRPPPDRSHRPSAGPPRPCCPPNPAVRSRSRPPTATTPARRRLSAAAAGAALVARGPGLLCRRLRHLAARLLDQCLRSPGRSAPYLPPGAEERPRFRLVDGGTDLPDAAGGRRRASAPALVRGRSLLSPYRCLVLGRGAGRP